MDMVTAVKLLIILVLSSGLFVGSTLISNSKAAVNWTNFDYVGYLEKYGYMEYARKNRGSDVPYEDILKTAVSEFQLNFGIPETGVIDGITKIEMLVPRCGIPDVTDGVNTMRIRNRNASSAGSSKYELIPGRPKWPYYDLSYSYLNNVPEDAKEYIVSAFQQWENVSDFTFDEAKQGETSDIIIGFFSLDHGDGHPFDGPGGTLAHATAPTSGKMHFDADEIWSYNNAQTFNYVDLKSVAMHEIGHLLGLDHSEVKDALMAPTIPAMVEREITEDDIDGINVLYPD